ncbi:hypothetical protein [Epilithonimonas lactis]|uniref:Uncharacterized protein n=1 Tax=Epilithonimonas lactis TaxID=421072 RepID=A0A085BFR3_9FLAO|nr:hypothetical protein [Epilithonimonas lactis]KFC21308.1 hypothetical protein IO89_14020 [Epilithonimonas lactis]SEP80646.1 hypothetical protein SAMN04488097_0707 [Epilithonimonas lactis]
MKKHLITRSLILVPMAFLTLQCNKTETSPAPAPQKLSLSDTVTAKPKLQPENKDDTTEKVAHYIANEYLTPGDLKAIPMSERKFRYQTIDLNTDGKMEIFVSFFTPYFCGSGGCSMVLLDDHLKPITKFTVTTPPLYAEQETTDGWKTLLVQDRDGWKQLTFKDGKYPSNPSVLPASTKEPSDYAQGIFTEQLTEHQF